VYTRHMAVQHFPNTPSCPAPGHRPLSTAVNLRTGSYKEAADALAAWEQAIAPRAAEFVKDYRRLVAELERDILLELLEHDM
jgi:hypothetical protein